jgi:NAD(P)-dependent dehydrogenase (short-subunit alcohol dehydrogenase family)
MPSVWRLDGRNALVTGGTRGIGRAVADELAELGAKVIVVARSPDPTCPHEVIAGDVTDAATRARVVARVDGPLHVLVHNAGTNIRGPLTSYDDATIEKLIALNLTAPLLLSRDLHPRLKEAAASGGNGAAVIHVGSVAGQVALPTGVAYAAAKAGLADAARTLALEWARDGIRVNSVAPWYTRTPLVEPVLAERRSWRDHRAYAAPADRGAAWRSHGRGVPRDAGRVVRHRSVPRGRRWHDDPGAAGMIQLLDGRHVDEAIAHVGRLWAEPDDVRSRPYSSDVPFDAIARTERYRAGWSKRTDEPGWSRTWGLRIDGAMCGHCDLKGGQLASELHRATIGIGIQAAYCNAGHGRRMMEAVIAWGRESGLDWIDLGVFSNNTRAIALYRKLGFSEIGVSRDRFRIDGESIDDISMALAL